MTWTITDAENGRCRVERAAELQPPGVIARDLDESAALDYVSKLYHFWSLDMPGEREVAAATPSGANAPYKLQKRGDMFVVVNNAGDVKSSFTDRDKALAYLRALYANVKGAAARAAKVKFTGNAARRGEKASMPGTPLHAFVNSGVQDLCSVCGLIKEVCQARFALSSATTETSAGKGSS